jgi:uracil phosphoribosyltransferase
MDSIPTYTEEEIECILEGVRIFDQENNPIINELVLSLRNVKTPIEKLRKDCKKLGSLMAYEISKSLSKERKEVETPMGEKSTGFVLSKNCNPVLIDVLGASIYMVMGFEEIFEGAQHALLSARRRGKTISDLKVEFRYERMPHKKSQPVIFIDPAIATAYTLTGIYKILKQNPKKYGQMGKKIVAGVVGTPFAVANIKSVMGSDTEIYLGSLDLKLNKKCYIHGPGYKGLGGGGIGDAGDRFLGVIPVD